MIFDNTGRRKYLTPKERDRFIATSLKLALPEQTFCLMLAYSGCRISEALETQKFRIDDEMRAVIIRCLKKRRPEPVFRVVPLPDWVLDKFHQHSQKLDDPDRLWPWSRGKGWYVVKRRMATLELTGIHACPKGLRHGFGIAAVQSGMPLNLVQRWLGHEKLETTAIYANAIGDEERAIVEKFWGEQRCEPVARALRR